VIPISLLEIANTHHLRLLHHPATSHRYQLFNPSTKKLSEVVFLEPNPNCIVVSRDEQILLYEWDDKHLCLYLPKSLEDIYRVMTQHRYPRIQEGDYEVVFKFDRYNSTIETVLGICIPRLGGVQDAASHQLLFHETLWGIRFTPTRLRGNITG